MTTYLALWSAQQSLIKGSNLTSRTSSVDLVLEAIWLHIIGSVYQLLYYQLISDYPIFALGLPHFHSRSCKYSNEGFQVAKSKRYLLKKIYNHNVPSLTQSRNITGQMNKLNCIELYLKSEH